MLFFVILAVLAFSSGFFSSYLGLGSGLLIVSLLPGFSPAETIQISLILLFFITGSNSLIFFFNKLMAWDWIWPLVFVGVLFAFLGGSLISSLSDFQVRFLLWCFLGFIVIVPFIKTGLLKKQGSIGLRCRSMDKNPKISDQIGIKIFSGSLMGLCSGLSGLGGSLILSPLLHESKALPFKRIAPSVSVVTWFFAVFAISGQQWRGFSIWDQDLFRQAFPILLVSAFVGLTVGHIFHKSDDRKRRLLIIRILITALFLKVSVELPQLFLL